MGPSRTLAVLAATVLLVGGGCEVDDQFLDQDAFACMVGSDCGEGWSCVAATPYATNFCAPECSDSCDGTCTGGRDPVCLRDCAIAEDGTPGRCQSEDFSCIRTSTERDMGVCYPTPSCESSDECAAGEVCLTELFRELNPDSSFPFDNLYCVPRANAEDECPPGSTVPPFSPMGSTPICFPDCSVSDPRCPPAMACLTQLQQLAVLSEEIDGPTCAIGNYGLSCTDDTNCFVGSCLDTGTAQGKICSITCNEASRLASGCQNLISPYTLQGIVAGMACDPSAPSDDGSGLCVLRYKINFPGCTAEPGGAYECAEGLDCRTLPTGGGEVDVCTKDCETDEECNGELGSNRDNWLYECHPFGICLFPSPEDG